MEPILRAVRGSFLFRPVVAGGVLNWVRFCVPGHMGGDWIAEVRQSKFFELLNGMNPAPMRLGRGTGATRLRYQ